MKFHKKDEDNNLEFKAYSLVDTAVEESTNKRKIVRVGLIQNSIVLPTNSPINDQRNALHDHIENIINSARDCGINILCLQEAWSKLFNFLIIFLVNI